MADRLDNRIKSKNPESEGLSKEDPLLNPDFQGPDFCKLFVSQLMPNMDSALLTFLDHRVGIEYSLAIMDFLIKGLRILKGMEKVKTNLDYWNVSLKMGILILKSTKKVVENESKLQYITDSPESLDKLMILKAEVDQNEREVKRIKKFLREAKKHELGKLQSSL